MEPAFHLGTETGVATAEEVLDDLAGEVLEDLTEDAEAKVDLAEVVAAALEVDETATVAVGVLAPVEMEQIGTVLLVLS